MATSVLTLPRPVYLLGTGKQVPEPLPFCHKSFTASTSRPVQLAVISPFPPTSICIRSFSS